MDSDCYNGLVARTNGVPAKMLTVGEVNSTFAEKGVDIKLPLPTHFLVKDLQVLERRKVPGGVGLLLRVEFINDNGEEVTDLFHCEGGVKVEGRRKTETAEIQQPPLTDLLPLRSKEEFESDDEVKSYLKEAISHLLQDKGYRLGERNDVDLYFERQEQGFFVSLAVRCDESLLEKAKILVELRQRHGVDNEYGLIVPAFQDSLGVPLLSQERWMLRNQEFLAINRIGVYAVDNWNPNLLYAFTIHPSPRDLKKYFMTTGPKWSLVRSRYVLGRSKKKAAGLESPSDG